MKRYKLNVLNISYRFMHHCPSGTQLFEKAVALVSAIARFGNLCRITFTGQCRLYLRVVFYYELICCLVMFVRFVMFCDVFVMVSVVFIRRPALQRARRVLTRL